MIDSCKCYGNWEVVFVYRDFASLRFFTVYPNMHVDGLCCSRLPFQIMQFKLLLQEKVCF